MEFFRLSKNVIYNIIVLGDEDEEKKYTNFII